uniref:ATP synthase subunit a n=1 Tax=Megalophasma granulatum TaxID=2042296 RepID=A0A343KJS9_9NEOP|nr:ATP synthase F0 subunit 6 [Megalophasma granulatum]
MMTNLFSIFDPTTSLMSLKLNWIISMISLLLIPVSFWTLNNRHQLLWMSLTKKLNKEFKTLLNNNKSTTLMFMSMFSLIMINNLLGLFPHLFTSTSHLSMTMTMALPIWLSLMLYGWMNKSNHMFTHLVPNGTPPVLMPFMVCIETISNIMRPGTLSVRLSANMIAGHLIMTLLGNTLVNMNINLLWMMILVQMLLLTLETAVAFIQAYVFAVLTVLYSSEVN